MKSYLLIILGILLHLLPISAQEVASSNPHIIQRENAVYLQNFIIFPVLYYDRVVSLTENYGLIPRFGFGFYDASPIPIFGASIYYGRNKHLGELGVSHWAFEGFSINANYRFTSRKGFLFKVGFEIIPEEEGHPIIGLGYAF